MSAYGNHPAFPNESASGRYFGLTKRELFAAMALQGILANQKYDPPRRQKLSGMAIDAVAAADALIAELAKDGVA